MKDVKFVVGGSGFCPLKTQTMDTTAQYLGQYLNVQELNNYNNPTPGGMEVVGRAIILDYPIKGFQAFACKVLAHMIHYDYRQHMMIVANEAGAILGLLLAAGYTQKELIPILASGRLDIIDLVEGKTKIKGKTHKKVHGADHKGLRLAERLQQLLREKLKAPEGRTILLSDLKVPFYVTALDELTSSVITLCAEKYPDMSATDAVMASCAVQPYINRVEYTDKEKKVHKLFCCSPVHTLPIDVVEAECLKRNVNLVTGKHLLGFGYAGQINEIAKKTSKDSKNAYLETLNMVRPKTVIPSQYAAYIRLY
jgi:hypothetical protein